MKNNIKIISTTILLISAQNIFAQKQYVGIMTSNPKDKLHISGPSAIVDNNIGTTGIPLITPTVRVDGLNITNNASTFTGADTTTPLYVDSNGDTLVKKGLETMGTYTQPGGDAITTNVTLNITADQTYYLTPDLLSASFTLKQRSMVYISSTLSADVQNATGGAITDGKSRAIAALIWFTTAPAVSGISTVSSYMSDGTSFSSRSANSMNTSFKFNPSCEVILPAGTYKIVLRGAGIASKNAPDDNYRVIWGGGAGDKLNVFAKPL